MSVDNYANTINICNKELNKRLNKKVLWDDDETVSQLFDILYTAYWQQIHKVLVPQENKTAEAEIRSHIRCIISNHLLPLYAKVEKLMAALSNFHILYESPKDLFDQMTEFLKNVLPQ